MEGAQARGETKKNLDARVLARNLFPLYFFALVTRLGSGERSPQGAVSSLREMIELERRGASVVPSRNRRKRLRAT
jgi:hypothetical protein